MSKIAIIRTSPHAKGNTNILADQFKKGAEKSVHEVEEINLSDCQVNYCRGCYGTDSKIACTKTGICWQKDSINELLERIRSCDAIVFATPIYFYSISGQMKVFLDRMVPLYGKQYNFKDIYLITASESGHKSAIDGAVKAVEGWMSCFPGTRLAGTVSGTGALAPGEIAHNTEVVEDAFRMGQSVR